MIFSYRSGPVFWDTYRPTLFHLWDLRCFRCVKFF